MHTHPSPESPQPFPAPFRQPDTAPGNMDAPPLDSETAALFRATLLPLITRSPNWPALIEALKSKGYGLAFRHGRLFLISQANGKRVCSLRFLGMPLGDLVARLGRPVVRARRGECGDGMLVGQAGTGTGTGIGTGS